MKDLIPTPEEQRAIATLKRLAKRWPKSLWLFSASGTLTVMRAGPHGKFMHVHDRPAERFCGGLPGYGDVGSGLDPDYCLDTVDIPNDGGDW